jgi:proteasome lid subunit RPN8/RPN11
VIVLTPQQAAALRAHAERTYPEECCGVLIGRADGEPLRVELVREIANVHEGERRRRFLLDPRQHLAAQKEARSRGLAVIGVYHSHPDHASTPSEHDRLHAWPNLRYLIVTVERGTATEITSWTLADDGSAMLPEPLAVEPRRDHSAVVGGAAD